MKFHHIVMAAILAAFFNLVGVLTYGIAQAHTGSPTPVTWTAGQRLTVDDLNNTIAHIHNTLSAGIVNANISTSAAIAHSKLATPALVPKAWTIVTANCDGAAAAGTDCTFVGSQVTAVSAQGAGGVYCVDLAFTPSASFSAQVTSHLAAQNCIMTDRNAGGGACGADTYNMYVRCYDYAGAAANNSQFSVLVMDT